ncbi:MAG: hypothetical protein ABWY07_10030 [Burkholderiales bacterium]
MTMALSFDATAQVQIAVEYHHKGWDHYFVTASPSEIALLDRGAFNGAWTRTGQTFPVWGKAVEGAQQTCRFFSTTFDPRSSHFYTPFSDECSAVSANKDWQSEGIAFYIKPASADGSCPAGMAALYRFYNNGAGGAPNHRYTASETTAAQMRSAGWTQEGSGASGAFACVPKANPSDDGDRVIVYVQNGTAPTVPAANDWVIRYSYRVPPMPGKTWDPNQQTFYIWGDVDFDAYGSEGPYAMSGYRFNQISPQLSIGRSLVSNDAGYAPGWQTITSWVVQAQYFWQKGETPFALAGEVVHVSPGELIETEIAFSAVTGHIVATITAPGGRSSIDIPRPFPNEPSLFADWKDFFHRAAQKSGGVVYATPAMQVEPYFVDIQTQCSILPFHIDLISLPGVPATTASFTYQSLGTVTCPTDLARLAF